MKDRDQASSYELAVIGAKEPLQEWETIDWKKINKRVKNLRQRIYRATQNGQWNKVRCLKKLMIRSYSNLLLSMRRVTQENRGKRTAGIDGQKALTPKERVVLERRFVSKGSVIIEEGDEGYSAYLIQSGEVEVYSENEEE